MTAHLIVLALIVCISRNSNKDSHITYLVYILIYGFNEVEILYINVALYAFINNGEYDTIFTVVLLPPS